MPFLMGICELVKIDKQLAKAVMFALFVLFFDTNLDIRPLWRGLSECEPVEGILHSFSYFSELLGVYNSVTFL